MLSALKLTRSCLWSKKKTLYRSIDYYTNLSNQKFLSWKNLLNKRFKETLTTTFFFLDLAKLWSSLIKKSVHRKLLCQIIFYRCLLISPLFTSSGIVDLTTPFGGAGIKTNVGPPASGNNLLTTAVIGLGASSLVATIGIAFFNSGT